MKIRSAAIEWCLARMAVIALRALFLTVRTRWELSDPEASPYRQPGADTYLYCVWHDSLIMPLFVGRQPRTKALVGLHRDGTFLVSALGALGLPTVRGSSSRGGAQAVRQLLNETEGYHIVMTPDGPRGPRRTMKQGLAYIASRTGKPVVPTAFLCSRGWAIGTGWTDLIIPKPFCTVRVVAADGIVVPPDASREELDEYTRRIQTEMDRLNPQREPAAAKSAGDPATDSEKELLK
ncbi:MAG: lysophospholipid acyltransferase family protein [Planctomyces sp.]|nr:lysophospholipid acyltransferase family protein [Planctomyces sp.]